MDKSSAGVIIYHEHTKHRPERYARGPMHLDWETQPAPFRRYKGTRIVELPLPEEDPPLKYLKMYQPGAVEPRPFTIENVSTLFALSMGLSAWKGLEGSAWALRINPSSGNLHPTEAYPILYAQGNMEEGAGGAEGAGPSGVYHYAPDEHLLEERARLDEGLQTALMEHFGPGMLIALSSVPWREAWKYGERAFRYCNLDAGHAMAAIRFSAALLGWKTLLLSRVADQDLKKLLGFDKTRFNELEEEVPDCLLLVHPEKSPPPDLTESIISAFSALKFAGEPNTLSPDHARWEAIDQAIALTEKPATAHELMEFEKTPLIEGPHTARRGAAVIRQRRSGQAYDALYKMERDAFFAICDKTLPREGSAPFDLMVRKTSVHLAVFVHGVTGLDSGLYLLVRDKGSLTPLKESLSPEFVWDKAQCAPPALPLYLLKKEDLRATAAYFSCRQEIAGDSAFSLGMMAEFRDNVEARPWSYRSLHWEAGVIGQVLYLEAEAHGARGTGIGCFYDDTVHDLLGIKDSQFQSIYHFTIGRAFDDTRIKTFPPYYHLTRT